MFITCIGEWHQQDCVYVCLCIWMVIVLCTRFKLIFKDNLHNFSIRN